MSLAVMPTQLGRFRLGPVLGSGGTAVVVRAEDTVLGVPRAIKRIAVSDSRSRASLRVRLHAEARAMARLNHPNILRIYDVAVDGDHDYVVMDLAEGGSLAGWLEARGPLPQVVALSVMIQVLSALSAAHAAGIVHRDVKPQNILLDRGGAVLLGDFGIALLTQDDAMRTTRAGVAMGSPCFMPPEQRLDARSVGIQADIYACGTTLYNLLTHENPVDLFEAGPDSPRWAGLPGPIRAVLQRATARRPSERYPDARAMATEIAALLADASEAPLLPFDPLLPRNFPAPSQSLNTGATSGPQDPSWVPDLRGTHAATRQALTFLAEDLDGLADQLRQETAVPAMVEGSPDARETQFTAYPAPPAPLDVPAPASGTRNTSLFLAFLALFLIVGSLALGSWVAGTPEAPRVETPVTAAPVEAPAPPPAVASPAAAAASSTEAAPAPKKARRATSSPELAPSGPAPLGTWSVSFAGRPATLTLSGTPGALRGALAVRMREGAEAVVTPVTGTFDTDTRALRLADTLESPDAGDYSFVLREDLSHFDGRFVVRADQRTLPVSGWRKP